MGKNDDKSLKVDILAALATAKGPIKINELLSLLKTKSSQRTVQRALQRLLADKLIYRLGQGPATHYRGSVATGLVDEAVDPKTTTYQEIINLSQDSKKIKNYVSQSISHRRPVSYEPKLLDDYLPNKTSYLDTNTRALLHQIGKIPEELKSGGTYGHEILHRLLIDLSWASSKLEGNTYSRLDTQNLIDYEQLAEGKDAIEAQMILNHKQAIKFLVENLEAIEVNNFTILNLHGLLSESLLPNPKDSGNLRSKMVDISGSVYRPTAIPQLINERFTLILGKACMISDPFEQAFFIMVHIPYLQAFIDVNKRVSRLAANIPLLKHKLCPLTFIGLPEQAYIDGNIGVYELQNYSLLRDVFLWAYERSAQEYLAVQKSMVAPDLVRLKYRAHIHKLIRQIVLGRNKNYLEQIKKFANANIEKADQNKFENIILDDLHNLCAGVLARYELNLDQFAAWQNTYD